MTTPKPTPRHIAATAYPASNDRDDTQQWWGELTLGRLRGLPGRLLGLLRGRGANDRGDGAPHGHQPGQPAWIVAEVGRGLYVVLFSRLAAAGCRTARAEIALPNPGSEALHRSLGFAPVGTYRRIGWKHGRWHDVLWLQLPLGGGGDPGAERIEPSP